MMKTLIIPWINSKKEKRESVVNSRESSKFSWQTTKPCKSKFKQDKTKQNKNVVRNVRKTSMQGRRRLIYFKNMRLEITFKKVGSRSNFKAGF